MAALYAAKATADQWIRQERQKAFSEVSSAYTRLATTLRRLGRRLVDVAEADALITQLKEEVFLFQITAQKVGIFGPEDVATGSFIAACRTALRRPANAD
ncbi:hypothetical protein [Streptomyces nigrescens]|uniref:Uncharacterized protein n=1 Tax=Streptomyces nigrescens TaxID=1920 RepID=A0A640TB28_STRNI|nr:hypothetical protein [Streptomyces libani]WAT95193.1 hypothetical protein STRLI_000882 [Streptomyces libani subsp. libani]GFE20374.1 hypothetical protein Sliba_08270 [Streptomyces libani subsp. libani]GGV86793.1 hypothetical protein GCM10010500_05710 [Streptomyces libani subsp. libani]